MELLVMCGAEWDRKLIADLDAQYASLRISHMVGTRGDRPQMTQGWLAT